MEITLYWNNHWEVLLENIVPKFLKYEDYL